MRQIVLDTETTGLEVAMGHRIIEIGCVELVSRRPTGRHFHRYLNPEREVDEGAVAVHGLTLAKLSREPRFAEIVHELLDFLADAELIIHNAAFDVGFLNAELSRVASDLGPIDQRCRVLDTLLLAREMHPGQRNSLDALCKRYGVDNSKRDLHGALLDAQLLAEVYVELMGGLQASFGLDAVGPATTVASQVTTVVAGNGLVVAASAEEQAQHSEWLAKMVPNSLWHKEN